MNIGVICPSEIAIRRFMPALKQCKNFKFAGIGAFSKEERFGTQDINEEEFKKLLDLEIEKAQVFVDNYGGRIYDSYTSIVTSPEIDAIYIPLPPALHFKWAKMALECGKNVLVEKPATSTLKDSKELVEVAQKNGLALHENYMFAFHDQLNAVNDIVKSGRIGDVRLYRISFGFPRRDAKDFRYNKMLGGGALIDAGGYTIRYATMLLGDTAKLKYAQSNFTDEFEVDMYGSAAFVNSDGITAQIAFGMDNNYKCDLEVWGSKGCLTTGRILTAPVGFTPTATIRNGNEETIVELPSDDAFLKSINHFYDCTYDETKRIKTYQAIVKQAELVESFREASALK